jgi:hypothetical protein
MHLGLYLDGVDYRGAMAAAHSPDARMLAAGVGLLIAGAQAITAKVEAPKLKARLEVVERMSVPERTAEAGRKPSILARAGDLTDIRFVAWDGFREPWATARDGELGACLHFRHQTVGKVKLNFRNLVDLQLAVQWVRELVGPDRVEVKFATP